MYPALIFQNSENYAKFHKSIDAIAHGKELI
jgi:hypothetical protein